MMVKLASIVVVGALALGALPDAAAQKVYRCGPDGRIYQQTACPEGKPLDASDSRTAEQREAAQAVAKSEGKTAAQFDRDMAPASAAKSGKSKSQSAPPSDKSASDEKSASKKKAEAEAKPPVYLVPQPKAAASAAK